MAKKKPTQPTDVVQTILDALHKAHGGDSALRLGDGAPTDVSEVIPTGVELIDRHLLGVGGFPVGRLVELYGEEGTGKSSLVFAAIAGVQAMGGLAVMADTEHALSTERAAVFGVDLTQVILLQPSTLEDTLKQVETTLQAIPQGIGPILLVWDSVAATPTAQEVEEGLDKGTAMGVRARVIGLGVRVLLQLAVEKRACLLFVNQVREKIGLVFGDKWTTPGGAAIKFGASVRLQLMGGKAVKDGDKHVGKIVTIRTSKNKLTPPNRTARVRLDYETGWNDCWTTLEYAKDAQVIGDRERGAKAWAKARLGLGWTDSLDAPLPGAPVDDSGDTGSDE
jgi:recombination protein RecA